MFGGRSQVSGSFSHVPLIPAKAGIHGRMDPGFRRDDTGGDFAGIGYRCERWEPDWKRARADEAIR